ncbi:MAG: pre-peptidase C-terminal domain-containing protein [Deltaproteobacteria bacterium]|nr:pre-peptidase C-terminal domain-containing protein [Deltaproteobacteria bacterium]
METHGRWRLWSVVLAGAAWAACVDSPAGAGLAQCCSSDDECVNGYACVEGACQARCTADEQCPTGQQCTGGVCGGGLGAGNPCAPGYQGGTGPGNGTPRDASVVDPNRDAGPPRDASVRDAAQPDGAVEPDGGPPDASIPDAGRPDAGRPDAGRPDAGRPDAGRPDAGRPDAGRPDAGRPDAGRPDAGRPDAGRPDAGRPDAGPPDSGPVCAAGDVYESNDGIGSAAAITTLITAAATCGGDADWFAIPSSAGDDVNVAVTLSRSDDAFTLELRDAVGNLLLMGTRVSGTAWSVAAGNVAGRTHLVARSSSPWTTTYDARLTLTTPMNCIPDAFEPNNSLSRATLLPGAVAATICQGDEDFFVFDVAAAGTQVTADMIPGPSTGDLDLILRNPAGEEIGRSEAAFGQETISLAAPQAGRYAVQVYGFPSGRPEQGTGPYTLSVAQQPGGGSCFDDRFEENDTLGQATQWGPDEPLDGTLCPGDDDVILVWANGDLRLSLNAQAGTSATVFHLSAEDLNGRVLQEVRGPGPSLSLVVPGQPGEPLYVRISAEGLPPEGAAYTFLASSGANCGVNDPSEPNEGWGTAATYRAPSTWGTICPGEEDWFRTDGAPGDNVTVTLSQSGPGFLGAFEVWDGLDPQRLLATSTPQPGGQGAAVTDASGTLRVRIRPAGMQGVDYVLTVNRSSTNTCVPDNWEPNDTMATSRAYTGPVQAQVCQGDRDFFSVDVRNPGARITTQLFPLPGAGNLDVRVRKPDATVLAVGSQPGSNAEFLEVTTSSTGRHTVEVYGAPEGRPTAGTGPYLLQVDVREPSQGCTNDAYESNNTVGTATFVEPGRSLQARLCDQDLDHYAVQLPDTGRLDVTLEYQAPPRMRLSLLDRQGTVLAESSSGTGFESLSRDGVAGDILYVRVQGPPTGTGGRDYALTLSLEPMACQGDTFEPNNAPAEATPLAAPAFASSVLCTYNDLDFFAVTATVGRAVEITLRTGSNPEGPLDLVLIAPDGSTPVGDTYSQTGPIKVLRADIRQPGAYFLQVADSFGTAAGVPYSVSILVLAVMQCADDALEENDSAAQARVQNAGTTLNGMACPADDDWYQYSLRQGTTYTFSLAAPNVSEAYFDVVASNGVDVLATGMANVQPVSIRPSAAGTYFVRVYFPAVRVAGRSYSFTVRP